MTRKLATATDALVLTAQAIAILGDAEIIDLTFQGYKPEPTMDVLLKRSADFVAISERHPEVEPEHKIVPSSEDPNHTSIFSYLTVGPIKMLFISDGPDMEDLTGYVKDRS